MIYTTVEKGAPIRQGDIFTHVPRIEFALREMVQTGGDASATVGDWRDLAVDEQPINLVVQARPVMAIVVTQDCDAARAQDVSLCEIRPFHEVEGRSRDAGDTAKKWVSLVTQHARMNLKWFYMPVDPAFAVNEKMAVDFRVVLRLGLDDLQSLGETNRVGRLNNVATEHFRERLAEFFRRYAYDEWYPLDDSEFEYYQSRSPEPVEPFPWQRPPTT